jgi:hypothetical protein
MREEAAEECARFADSKVDEIFADWEKAAWDDGHPESVSRAWLQIATGEYFERIQGANTVDPNTRGKRMRKEGIEELNAIAGAGGPMINGKRQAKSVNQETSSRQIRLGAT